ncbi:hypothetical protein Sgly_1998 [Syntrophobotulus glycolicus DSM 8271]|uniref:DUF4367 domain-containing protein n=1 Tax=Syntrophobotulus glycolicus (strain DSM 8271 / FlGlyR) TaxID=645991 RepID=F0T1F1_SYNGF|nr:DUF4367 domain-containing protein [Syntrophobotulus glycolicus]ADY56292.1 hypothetical protein Sgly_1998 [Syntrophobotulus glycolicus DSM 8271]
MREREYLEENFSIDLEAYLNGTESEAEIKDREYEEMLKFSQALAGNDFSKSSNKKSVANKVLKSLNEKRSHNKLLKKVSVSAASFAIICGIFSQTAFATDLVDKVIKAISLGNITVIQSEPSNLDRTIPNDLQGKIFNQDGQAIKEYPQDGSGIYNAQGQEITGFSNGEIVTREQMSVRKEVIKDYSQLARYLSFDVKLPAYLPENYTFDRAELYKGEKGKISKDYVDLFFVNEQNGKVIFMQQRASKEETKYTIGTDGKIEEVKVNGVNAVISDDTSIDWEANQVLYSMSGKGDFPKEELIKIAESI